MLQRPLTDKQETIYEYFIDYAEEHGDMPTFREIMEHLGFKSTSSVHAHVQALVKKGYLEKAGDTYRFTDEALFLGPRRREALEVVFEEVLWRYQSALRQLGLSAAYASDEPRVFRDWLQDFLRGESPPMDFGEPFFTAPE